MGLTMIEMGEPVEAISMFEKAIQRDPNIPTFHNNLGLANYNNGHHDDALKCFETAKDLNLTY
jgi:tetratricopeptide (TPR) repeat protein